MKTAVYTIWVNDSYRRFVPGKVLYCLRFNASQLPLESLDPENIQWTHQPLHWSLEDREASGAESPWRWLEPVTA